MIDWVRQDVTVENMIKMIVMMMIVIMYVVMMVVVKPRTLQVCSS